MRFRPRVSGPGRTLSLTAAVAALVFAAGAQAGKGDDYPAPPYDSSARPTTDQFISANVDARASGTAEDADTATRIPGLYIVQFKDAPVASYRGGENGIAAIPRLASRGNRADMRSAEALRYADVLRSRQQQFVGEVNRRFGTSLRSLATYQFALNGLALKLNPEQLAYVAKHPSVRMIEPVKAEKLDTDVGPAFIGAPNVWNGSATGGAPGTAGEGIVVGVLDSGVNWESPSFADIGGDGYNHDNPLGAGNYLGVCDTEPADPDIGPNCNDKLIGAYAVGFDFTQQVNFECANPNDPGNELGLDPATCAALGVPLLDYDNALDENGHGSHTASTAAGNEVAINFEGNNVTVQGVAKHANLVAYDVCFTRTTGANAGQGSCFTISSVAAIEQVVADGVVDVINFSIGGGAQPWSDAGSQAFLAAVDAGVFVSASAGNSGPAPATLGHNEPWVATVAASTHTRGGYNIRYTANGTTVPSTPGVTNQPVFVGTAGSPHTSAIVNQPIRISSGIDTTTDGCVPFSAGAFAGSVAVIRRGGCSFSIKANNAAAAGAIGVIIANNQPGNIAPANTPGDPIPPFPVFGATQAQSNVLRDYINVSNLGAGTVTIPVNAVADTVQGDVMAGFSSRGPSPFEAQKPDITGPGVNILAAYVVDPSSASGASGPNGYDVISGTSMSSPHNAGAAALVRAVHPTWTVAEVKSALMLTSRRNGIVKEDGVTPADPFDRGAGRMDLNFAARAGLVMDETPLRMFQADPAAGGDPSSLNIASIKSNACVGECTFTRRVRSVASTPVTYTASFASTSGLDVTITPSTFTINPGQSQTLTIEVDVTQGATFNAFNFGDIVLSANIVAGGAPYVETVTPGTPVAIPDGTYAGGFGGATQACVNIDTTGDVAGLIAGAELQGTFTHTWVGDLTFKLRSPSGAILGIMSLPGLNEPADDGTGSSGENANLVATHPITFRDTAATSAEAMGANLAADSGNVCQTAPSACEYSPAPGSITQPPLNFAGLAGGPAAGVWTFCAGDSVGFDAGTIRSLTLTIQPGTAAAPESHFPLAIFAVEPSPLITFDPSTVSGTAAEGGAPVDVTLTIGNDGPVDLDWNENSVPGAAPVWSQAEDSTGGIVSDFFQGDGTGAYSANDFVVNVETTMTEIFTPGFDNTASLAAQTSVTWMIFPDDNGVPEGDPETNPAPAVWSYTANIGDPEVDITGDDITLDLVAAGESLVLPAGTYWLSVFPSYTNAQAAGNRWNWSQGLLAGADTHLISPTLFGGVPDWTSLIDLGVTWRDTAFELTGIQSCGAPWMSVAPTSGTVAPGDTQDVTVTLDPDGLTAGVYNASLCIASNDSQTPIASVPVTFTVTGPTTNPTATGAASPAAAGVGETTLLTVDVEPGTNPTSTGITVAADLTSIGGSATQALLDNGVGGDAVAGDGVFSFTATVGAGSAIGATSFAVAVSDAQARTASTSIAFEVLATTNPSGTGLATPDTVALGGSTLLTVDTEAGSGPTSTGLAVSADLSSIGGSGAQAFVDNGTGGDLAAGDGVFSFTANIPLSAVPGAKSLPFTVTDAQSRSGSGTISLTVSSVSSPSGVGLATPATVSSGDSSLLTVTVTSGDPPSTGLAVVIDLSSVGGSATQQMFDDGTNGDAVAGDNVFSVSSTITGAAGDYDLTATISDAQARTATAIVDISIAPPAGDEIFADGFED